MNKQDIFTVLLKFLGIQLGFQAFSQFTKVLITYTRIVPTNPSPWSTLSDLASPFDGPIQMLLLIFYSFSCWYLLTHSNQLARRWVNPSKSTGITITHLLEMVFLYQGTGLIIYGLPSLLILIIKGSLFSTSVSELTQRLITGSTSLVLIVGIVLGLLMIFRAQQIAKWLTQKIPPKLWQ